METDTTLIRLLEELKKIHDLLADRIPEHRPMVPEQQSTQEVPEHVDITWLTGYFGISKGTFYNEVDGKLLEAILNIVPRPYYLKSDVIELMTESKKKHLGFKKLNTERNKKENK